MMSSAANTAPLQVVAVTIPPWPGEEEAEPVSGPWTPTAEATGGD